MRGTSFVIIFALVMIIAFAAGVFAQEVNLQPLSYSLVTGKYKTFTSQGDYAFAANTFGFIIFDISDPINPVEVAQEQTDGVSTNISVAGDYAFICDSQGGLLVYDISNLENPQFTGAFNPPGVIRSVCPHGDYLYACAEDYGLQIIDYSDPYSLELVDILYIGGETHEAVVYDDYLYVTIGEAGLAVMDIYNPEEPQLLMTWNTVGGNTRGLALFPNEGKLAMSDEENGIYYLDLAVPNIPEWQFTVSLSPWLAVDVVGGEDYGVGCYINQGLQSFNLQGDTLDFYQLGWSCGPIHLHDDLVYACRDSGFSIISCESPDSMYSAAEITFLGEALDIEIYNDIAYVTRGDGELSVLDISDPLNPIEVETVSSGGNAIDAIFSPDSSYLYISNYDSGVYAFSLADPWHPLLMGAAPTISDSGAQFFEMSEGFLYLSVYSYGYHVYDISDPANPQLINYNLDHITEFWDIAITEDGQHMFACVYTGELMVYTIYSADSIVYEYTNLDFEVPSDMVIKGDYAYIADFNAGLYVADISNYAYIFKVDSIPVQSAISGVSLINDQYLAMCEWENGITVVDISDPLDVYEVDHHETSSYAIRVNSAGNLLYVCDFFDLIIFDLYGSGVGEQPYQPQLPINEAFISPAYPNPFNSGTTLTFNLPVYEKVKLAVYNIRGEEVAVLKDSYCQPGEYRVKFDAAGLANGIYFARLKVKNHTSTQKLLLIK